MKKKILMGLLIFLLAGVAFAIKKVIDYKNSIIAYEVQQNIKAPIEIPNKNIVTMQEAIDSDKPILAMFYVDWCGYCRRYMPTFGQLAKELKDKYTIVAINCDLPENRKYVEENHIMGFPSLFVIDTKADFNFMLNVASMQDKNILKSELNKYLKLREKLNISE